MAAKFQHRHYEEIAKVFKSEVNDIENSVSPFDVCEISRYEIATVKRIAERLCLILSLDNPLFDPKRFMEACGFAERKKGESNGTH